MQSHILAKLASNRDFLGALGANFCTFPTAKIEVNLPQNSESQYFYSVESVWALVSSA